MSERLVRGSVPILMTTPRNDWPPQRPPYGPPQGPPPPPQDPYAGGPLPPYPYTGGQPPQDPYAGGPPPQPPGQPPQDPHAGGPPPLPPGQPPQAPRKRDRGGLIAGFVIISIGAFFLLAQVVPDIGRWIPLFIGVIFLAAFLPKLEYGFLIPGCIVSGVGIGVVLTGYVDDPWTGAVVLFSIGGGFIAIWIVSMLIRAFDKDWPRGESKDAAQALWWPLIPGGILIIIGFVVLADEGLESDLLQWWPLIIIGAGLVVLLTSLRRRN